MQVNGHLPEGPSEYLLNTADLIMSPKTMLRKSMNYKWPWKKLEFWPIYSRKCVTPFFFCQEVLNNGSNNSWIVRLNIPTRFVWKFRFFWKKVSKGENRCCPPSNSKSDIFFLELLCALAGHGWTKQTDMANSTLIVINEFCLM